MIELTGGGTASAAESYDEDLNLIVLGLMATVLSAEEGVGEELVALARSSGSGLKLAKGLDATGLAISIFFASCIFRRSTNRQRRTPFSFGKPVESVHQQTSATRELMAYCCMYGKANIRRNRYISNLCCSSKKGRRMERQADKTRVICKAVLRPFPRRA